MKPKEKCDIMNTENVEKFPDSFEKIKRLCYQKGAIDALNDMNVVVKDLIDMLQGRRVTVNVNKRLNSIRKKYNLRNILSGEELYRAQEMSE